MAQDASWQCSETRSRSGVLTPSSDGSSYNGSQAPSRKRKRDHIGNDGGLEDLISERFTVKPHPSSVHDRPRSLKPIALLSRSDLPLSYLDRSRPAPSALPDSRLYESHVKILELEQRMGSTPVILIAQLDDNKTVYAVEYESKGLYVIFKVGPWVDLDNICSVAVVSRHCSSPQKPDVSQTIVGSGESAHNAFTSAEGDKYSKKKRLAIEAIQSMVKRPSTSQSQNKGQSVAPESQDSRSPPDSGIQDGRLLAPSEQPLQHAASEEPQPEDILDGIRGQYFDTLYLSKVSTAYFAKGPLSRARAAFHLDYDSTLHMKDLIQFLDSLVLPTNTLDKKYKDGLQEFVSALDLGDESEFDPEDKTRPKKRKIKKVKLGKNGLYNLEDAFIKSWWESHDTDIEAPGATREESSRSRISKLRVREILLQIILILETVALQKLCPPSNHDEDLPFPGATEPISGDKTHRTKTKKPRDLPALVDVHLDRLCIWSLSSEEGRLVSKSETTNKETNLNAAGDKHAADILRSFCVEVVIPFFSARLPALCDTICRKLGGPRISSPARPSLKKSSSMSTITSRPSAANKKAAPIDGRRSLQRALTDEKARSRAKSRRPSTAVSLLRSATAPILPTLKREGSEAASLSSIPIMGAQSNIAGRTATQKSKKPPQTESDINFGGHADRQSKKASIEEELKNAIYALKKPNRQLAGQTMADLAEKRAVTRASQSRKAKKPTRNPDFENMRTGGIQILATPKKHRSQDMRSESQLFAERRPELELEPSFVPPSSVSRIPSSGQRLAEVPDSSPRLYKATPVPREQYRLPMVSATPTRSIPQPIMEYDLSVVDTTPIRNSSTYYGFRGASNQNAVVTDTPVRTTRAPNGVFENSLATPKLRHHIEIPPSPSPPCAPRNQIMDNFLLVPPERYIENISETPRKNATIHAKTKTDAQEEVGKLRSPLKPLRFPISASSHSNNDKGDFLERTAVAVDHGDIYKSLGWDDDDL